MHTPIPLIYSGRVRQALQWSERAHRGKSRKSGDHPYLLHPVAVGQLLAAVGADDDLLCAAYLHDVVEDTDTSLAEIEDYFGSHVARLVGGVTTPSMLEGRPLDKAEQSALVINAMSEAPLDVAALKAADLTTNLTDLVLDARASGLAHWQELFGERTESKITHYLELSEVLLDRLAEEDSYLLLAATLRERASQVEQLFSAWREEQAL